MDIYAIHRGIMKQLPDNIAFAWELRYWLRRALLIAAGMIGVHVIYLLARVWI